MTTISHRSLSTTGRGALPYRYASLAELAEHVLDHGDSEALHEIHNERTIFRTRGGQLVVMTKYVDDLSHAPRVFQLCGRDPNVLDRARDLTLDKFSRVPDLGNKGLRQQTHQGPDCRFYFRSFLSMIAQWRQAHPGANSLQEDTIAARILQRLVRRHFHLSCLEARRAGNPARSRYAWRINGCSLVLFMPVAIPGHQRRAWLDDNVKDPDPSRPGERERIQTIIDQRLGMGRHVSLDECEHTDRLPPMSPDEMAGLLESEVALRGLADVVAEEKADNVQMQRPSIRRLGPDRLKQFVLRVFEDLGSECYEEHLVAQEFGLSRSAVSRFAGSRWYRTRNSHPPDLWRNVAHTLAASDTFAQAAQEAGVWDSIAGITGSNGEDKS